MMNFIEEEDVPDKVSAFLGKLLNMIQDPTTDHLITWSKTGSSFVIKDQMNFTKELLPKYYKHSNMASFIRQLNMYGFHKVVSTAPESDEIEFLHPYFLKGRLDLIPNIRRKMNNSDGSRSNTFCVNGDSVKKLITDVRILKEKQQTLDLQLDSVKRENEILWRELSILRHKHATQQHIVNRLVRFLVSLAHPSSNNSAKRKCFPPMIKDSRQHISTEHEYCKVGVPSSREYRRREISPGPTIHEIHASDILDNAQSIGEPILDAASTMDVEEEFVTSPGSVFASNPSPELQSSPPSINSIHSRQTSTPSPNYVPSPAPMMNENPRDALLELVEETQPEEEYITIRIDPSDLDATLISSPIISDEVKKLPKYPAKRKGGKGRGRGRGATRVARSRMIETSDYGTGRKANNANLRSRYITADTPVVFSNSDGIEDEYILGLSDSLDIAAYEKESRESNKNNQSTMKNPKNRVVFIRKEIPSESSIKRTKLDVEDKIQIAEENVDSPILNFDKEPDATLLSYVTGNPAMIGKNLKDVTSAVKSNEDDLTLNKITDTSNRLFTNTDTTNNVNNVNAESNCSDIVVNNSNIADNNSSVPLVNVGFNSNVVDNLYLNNMDLQNNSEADFKSNLVSSTNYPESNMKVACPESFAVSGNKQSNKNYLDDINNHLDSVDADLNNLREIMKREGISLDYNTMLGLFNEGPMSYPELNPFDTKQRLEGNELISCPSPGTSNEFMDFGEWMNNWSIPDTPQQHLESINNDSYYNLNTPQLEPQYGDPQSPSKTKS